ncbi:MAG: S8 family peptidase [Monoglobaceae bacterium]
MRRNVMKTLSLILAFSMCLALLPQVYAAEAEPQPTSAEEIAADLPEIPENGDSAAAEDSDDSAKYTQNIVLFAMDSSSTADDISSDLSALGISSVEPLFTENGEAVGIGKKKEIWYRAYTSEEVTSVIEKITALRGVTYAEPEYIYSSDNYGEPTEVEQGAGWIFDSLLKHKSDFWWYTALNHDTAPGSGSVVAVIDTGVDYTHEDLAPNMWVNTAELYGTEGVDDDGNGYIDDIYGVDVTASGKKAGNPMDDNGHGTHVAGIIGMSANGTGGVGLAYGSKIMAIKAGYSTGSLASSNIAKAINYAHMMGADVINMSFGGTSKSYLIESALEDAFSDCVLVASAGNDGLPTTDADPAIYPKSEDIYPAAYPYVIGVMATDKFGTLAGFSNWDYIVNANAEYELTAPGVSIYSALPGNRYALWSGTSMAAPCVSAAAAILRSHFGDKDTYSSRFIMGQLTSATNDRTTVTRLEGNNYNTYTYPALDIYDSVNNLPKPNISVKKVFAMDNAREDNALNDGDSIIDAGETIDLGVLIRNQWGLTGDIKVTADAVSVGGVANPYIEFTKPEITMSPAGTFAESNNGFVWEDSLLTDVENPIQFKVSPETPNDTEICVNLTVTTTNGYDENDKAAYTAEYAYTFRVQSGRGIKGEIKEDTTLTKDYLWIVENTVHIPEGVTLTVEPGTKIQFYSSDYEDAYGGKTVPKILNDGTLNIIGTEDEPIEMYPGAGFENYCVEIAGDGIETLKYCNIINPKLGIGSQKQVNFIDHCTLTQNPNIAYYRYVSGGTVYSSSSSSYYINKMTNTQLYGLRYVSNYDVGRISFSVITMENCQFNSCRIGLSDVKSSINNVFMTGDIGVKPDKDKPSSIGYWYSKEKPTYGLTLGNSIYTYDRASSKYINVRIVYPSNNSENMTY